MLINDLKGKRRRRAVVIDLIASHQHRPAFVVHPMEPARRWHLDRVRLGHLFGLLLFDLCGLFGLLLMQI